MRAIRACAARLRRDDSEVATAYAKAGNDIDRVRGLSEAAGEAVAAKSAASGGRGRTPRLAPPLTIPGEPCRSSPLARKKVLSRQPQPKPPQLTPLDFTQETQGNSLAERQPPGIIRHAQTLRCTPLRLSPLPTPLSKRLHSTPGTALWSSVSPALLLWAMTLTASEIMSLVRGGRMAQGRKFLSKSSHPAAPARDPAHATLSTRLPEVTRRVKTSPMSMRPNAQREVQQNRLQALIAELSQDLKEAESNPTTTPEGTETSNFIPSDRTQTPHH